MRQSMVQREAATTHGPLGWGAFLALTLALMITLLAHMQQAGPRGILTLPTAHALQVGVINDLTTPAALIGTPPTTTAPYAFLFDATTGMVYYSKDADAEEPMASCTKIMTALLAVERGHLDDTITIGPDAAALVHADSSFMGVSAGEKLTLKDLLYGLMLPSGNDAAIAIADYVSGSVPAFVALMNQRAQQLGLTRTHFVTPNGLDLTPDGHYTSARDLAVLAAVAEQNATIRTITSTVQYIIPQTATHKAYDLTTGIDLLAGARSPYVGAIGVKPGYTGLAQYCEAFAAIRHGHLMVGAVLADPSWQVRITDMRALLDFGFAQIGVAPAPVVPSWTNPPPDPAS